MEWQSRNRKKQGAGWKKEQQPDGVHSVGSGEPWKVYKQRVHILHGVAALYTWGGRCKQEPQGQLAGNYKVRRQEKTPGLRQGGDEDEAGMALRDGLHGTGGVNLGPEGWCHTKE